MSDIVHCMECRCRCAAEKAAEIERMRGVITGLIDSRDWMEGCWKREHEEVKRLRALLREGVYEATHLSPELPDGSHWAKISKPWLDRARAALTQEKQR